jgi:hypothetical protein
MEGQKGIKSKTKKELNKKRLKIQRFLPPTLLLPPFYNYKRGEIALSLLFPCPPLGGKKQPPISLCFAKRYRGTGKGVAFFPVPLKGEKGCASFPVPLKGEKGCASFPVPLKGEKGCASFPVPLKGEKGGCFAREEAHPLVYAIGTSIEKTFI